MDTNDTTGLPPDAGMLGALSSLAYGQQGNPFQQLPGLLAQMRPDSKGKNEWLAFSEGMGAPTRTGALSEAIAAGAGKQLGARQQEAELQAKYVPLVMQSLVQSQQLALQAGNASRDYLKDVMPKVYSHMASLRAGDAKPTYQQAVTHLMQIGDQQQLPPQVLMSMFRSLPSDPDELAAYLDRLAVGAAGSDKMLPTLGTNAAGQVTAANPVRGTVKPLAAPTAAPGGLGTSGNPSSADVEFDKAARGDVKGMEENLRTTNQAFMSAAARMNEQAQFMKKFTPGRYAKMAGGAAALMKDIAARIPGIDKETVESLSKRLLAAPEGSEESLAALQAFDQLGQQEVLAQLRSSLGEKQMMNRAEYQNFAKASLGTQMDPATFSEILNFYRKEAANAANKYSAWAKYVKANKDAPSVTEFDAAWNKRLMDHYLSGSTEPYEWRDEEAVRPTLAPTGAPKPAASAPTPAPAQREPAAAEGKPDLKEYEPNTRIGPTGRLYVMENGKPRPARKVSDLPAEERRKLVPRNGRSAGAVDLGY